MSEDQEKGLRHSQKLALLLTLLNRKSIRPILEKMSVPELVEAHGFLWDKLVEIHYLTQRRDFVREQVTQRMIPSAVYQKQRGCDLRLDYCKGVECIWSNPACAGNKVINNMEVMARAITDSVHTCKLRQNQKLSEQKESKPWLV